MSYLLLLFPLLCLVGSLLFLALALLEQSLRNKDLILGRDAPVMQTMLVGQLACLLEGIVPNEELRHSGLLALMHSSSDTLNVKDPK